MSHKHGFVKAQVTHNAPEDQMKCRLLLNVVVAQSTTILKLLASKDETLLVWRDSVLITM